MQSDKLPKMPEPADTFFYVVQRDIWVRSVSGHGEVFYTAEQMQDYAMAARKAALEEGFDIGFTYSGEGWNGEHPGDAMSKPRYAVDRAGALELYEGFEND